MKKTLLEITIDVLNVIDGDEVNSISDTVESLQTAGDIQTVYYDIIGRKDWQFLRALKTLSSASDGDRPTHLILPEHTSKIETLAYNKRKLGSERNYYKQVHFKYPDEFLLYVNGRDNTAENYQEVVDVSGVKFTIRNDAHPMYFTSFDDKYIVMDNFNSNIEDTLQGQHTQALLFTHPTWSVDDGFVPELPAEMFPMFIAECMTYALAKKDDQIIQKTQQTATRHQRHLSQTHGVVQGGVRYQNYGRTPRKAGATNRSPLFGDKN
jgi:hypothetical protein